MSHRKFDKAAGEAIAQAVRDLERGTDAEVVIVVRGRSGSYAHADYLCGALLAFTGLLALLFAPFDFHTYWVPVDIAALFIAGAFVSSRSNLLRRLLTTNTFRSKAARLSAAAMFYEAGIANTHAETGMLIYLSILERRVEVFADRGILKAVPALNWNQALFTLRQLAPKPEPEPLIQALNELAVLLADHLPATGENPNELADGPRIELK